jgi:YebC/PmpR family DNA-binding regulatory protein
VAGHSKWANIKHRKERQDKKKGKVWSKCSRAIIAAARAGGGDPDTNLTLRYAIDEAKYANMPKDTIQRAIEKGAGAASGDDFDQITYEGYGPGGSAIIVDTLTDNKTRTVSDVRMIFKKGGGTMGNPGSVAFLFQTRGQIFVEAAKTNEDQIMETAIEAGAEDVQPPEGDDGVWTVLSNPADFLALRGAIEAAGIEIAGAEIAKIPDNTIQLRGEDAQKLLNLVEALEDNDDVQKVFTNVDIPEDELASMN